MQRIEIPEENKIRFISHWWGTGIDATSAVVNFGYCWPIQPRMAVGRCHHGLRLDWHRPDADTRCLLYEEEEERMREERGECGE